MLQSERKKSQTGGGDHMNRLTSAIASGFSFATKYDTVPFPLLILRKDQFGPIERVGIRRISIVCCDRFEMVECFMQGQ